MAIPTMAANSNNGTAGSLAGAIHWGDFTIRYDGVGYAIAAGWTTSRWVWWRYGGGTPVLEAGEEVPQDLTDDDLVLFANKNGTPFRVQSTQLLDGDLLVDGSIGAKAMAVDFLTTKMLTATQAFIEALQVNGTILTDQVEANGLKMGPNIDFNVTDGLVVRTPLGDIKLPADGKNPQFTGSATFDALTLLGNLSLQGLTNDIAKGSSLNLATGTSAPKASPVISAYYPAKPMHEGFNPHGIAYHTASNRWYRTESLYGVVLTATTEGASSYAFQLGQQIGLSKRPVEARNVTNVYYTNYDETTLMLGTYGANGISAGDTVTVSGVQGGLPNGSYVVDYVTSSDAGVVIRGYSKTSGQMSYGGGGTVTGGHPYGLGRTEVQNAYGGLDISGSTMWVLCQTNEATPSNASEGRWYVYRLTYNGSVWSYASRFLYEPAGFLGGNSTYRPRIAYRPSDGSVVIVQAGGGSGTMWATRFNASSGAELDRLQLLNADGSKFSSAKDTVGVVYSTADNGTERLFVCLPNDSTVYAFNPFALNPLTRDATYEFPNPSSADTRGLTYMGGFRVASAAQVQNLSGIKSSSLAAAYTFRKSNGTSPAFAQYETASGPAATTTTFPKRASLALQVGPIPDDPADPNDANAVTFYVEPAGSSGAVAALRRQAPPAAGATRQEFTGTLSTSGATPPTSSNFPAASPASITSGTGDAAGAYLRLLGDSISRLNGITGSTDSSTFNKGLIKSGVRLESGVVIDKVPRATDRREWMQSGTAQVVITSTNNTFTLVVTFPVAFPAGTTVDVVVSLKDFGHNTSSAKISATLVDTTKFTAQAQRTAGTGNIDFTWIAVARP